MKTFGRIAFGLGMALSSTTLAADEFAACMPGKTVTLASSSCANGWGRPKYKEWGAPDDLYGDGYDVTRLHKRAQGATGPLINYKVSAISPEHRMIELELPPDGKGNPKRVWVNLEAVSCGTTPNVSGYVQPPSDGSESKPDSCPCRDQILDPAVVQKLTSAANMKLPNTFFKRAEDYIGAVQKHVADDNRAILGMFESKNPKDQAKILKDAAEKLQKTYLNLTVTYGPGCSCDEADWKKDGSDPYFRQFKTPDKGVESARSRCSTKKTGGLFYERRERACRTVRDALAQVEQVAGADEDTRGAKFIGSYKKAIEASPVNNAQLAARTALFYGMGLETRKNRDPVLNFYDDSSGAPELNNGYLLGAGSSSTTGSALDCGGFAMNYLFKMTRTLEGKFREVPSVPDFETLADRIAALERKGSPPASTLSDYTYCFKTVDVRKDELLVPGDLVSSHGHIVMVAPPGPNGEPSYNPFTREIRTIEAKSGDFGTAGYGRRPLAEPDCQGPNPKKSRNWANRPIRSDLHVLRFAPWSPTPCAPGKSVGDAGCKSPCPLHPESF